MEEYVGTLFHGSLPWVLQCARNQLGSLTPVLSLPEMVTLLYSCSLDHSIWNQGSYTGLTQEIRTLDLAGNDVLLTIHGTDVLSSNFDCSSLLSSRTNVGVPMNCAVTNGVLRGRLLTGEEVPIFSLQEFLDKSVTSFPRSYIIVTPYRVIEEMVDSSSSSRKPLYENPLFVLRVGSPEAAYNLVEYVAHHHPSRNMNAYAIPLHHAHMNTDPRAPRGHFVELELDSLHSRNLMTAEANFLAVQRK